MPSKRTSPSKPTRTPVDSKVAENASKLVEDVKGSLEYALSSKTASVKVNGKLLTLRKWGLNKKLTLGVKVSSLVQTVMSVMPDEKDLSVLDKPELLSPLLGHVADDVMEIVAKSISEPFDNHQEAYEWLDDECTYDDLFNLAIIIWEMNLKGEVMGKFNSGLEKMSTKISKLVGNR